MLDVALSPDFANDPWVYLSYAEASSDDRAGTALGRGRLVGDHIEDWQVIFRQEPKLSSGQHFRSRLYRRDGMMHSISLLPIRDAVVNIL